MYETVRRKSPYRSSVTARTYFRTCRISGGHRLAELAILSQISVVRLVNSFQFLSRSSPFDILEGSTSQSGFMVLISMILADSTSSRYSFPSLLMWKSKAWVRSELPRKSRLASPCNDFPISLTVSALSLTDPYDSFDPILLLHLRRRFGVSLPRPSISSSTKADSHSAECPETWKIFINISASDLKLVGTTCAICTVKPLPKL